MRSDLPLADLWTYRPEVAEPADFDEFWAGQLRSVADLPLDVRAEQISTPATYADVFDVTFTGHGGARIRAWLMLPHAMRAGAPAIVEFVGYGGGRGDSMEWATWACAGYPHLIMDTRGQGGDWRTSDTPDPGERGAPSSNGFLTKGIDAPENHYYTRLFIDAARAVEAARALPQLTGRPVVTTGQSQGGALSIAAAHLAGDVHAVAPDVPFLAHIRRASEIAAEPPFPEIADYCRLRPREVERVFRTLSYIDVVNHAKRCSAPALFSVGLVDDITPPSTVFAAYHAYAGPKDIRVYEFNGHEGGEVTHLREQLTFVGQLSGSKEP